MILAMFKGLVTCIKKRLVLEFNYKLTNCQFQIDEKADKEQ